MLFAERTKDVALAQAALSQINLAPAVPNERRWLEVRAVESVQRTMSAARSPNGR
jgi:hypothetical protein